MALNVFRGKQFETEVAQRAMEAIEHLSHEMGAELHDDLMQRLVIFNLYFDRLSKSLSDTEEAEKILSQIKSEYKEVILSARKVSKQLMPVYIDNDSFGYIIEMLCIDLEKPGANHIHFETKGAEQILSLKGKNYLSRIIQELIHNAFKHSSAWHIWVRMEWQPTQLIIVVEDDGTGHLQFSEITERLKKKYNTLKMRSLAINATIEFEPGKKGLLARVKYPIPKK